MNGFIEYESQVCYNTSFMGIQAERDKGLFYATDSRRRAGIESVDAAADALAQLYGEFADVPVFELDRLKQLKDAPLPPVIRIHGRGIVPEVTGDELVVFGPRSAPQTPNGVVFDYHMAHSPIHGLGTEEVLPEATIVGQISSFRSTPGMAFAAADSRLFVGVSRSPGKIFKTTPSSQYLADLPRVLTDTFEGIPYIYEGFRAIYRGINQFKIPATR